MKLNFVLLFTLLIFLSNCGQDISPYGFHNLPPTACTVEQSSSGATITCPDGTTAFVSNGNDGATGSPGSQGPVGPAGPSGAQGLPGSNGYSVAFSQGLAPSNICSNGGTIISLGLDLNRDSILQTSETSEVATICNGNNGSNGTNSPPTPFTPIGLLAPCSLTPMSPTTAELSDPKLEVFIKLQNGTILTSFSDNIQGDNTHFAVLSPGNYISTGKYNCTFNVSSSGIITNNR